MDKKIIEEKFNILYNDLYNQHYLELSKIKSEIKKENNIRRLLWIGYGAFIIFSVYLLGIFLERVDSITLLLIIIFGLIAIWGILWAFIFIKFSKNDYKFYEKYHNTVYKFILEGIDKSWKYSLVKNTANFMNDYNEAKLPEIKGGRIGGLAITANFTSDIFSATFFELQSPDPSGVSTDYKGLYFSILNDNNISSDVFIRSKTYDNLFYNKPSVSKLNINTSNYNIYSKDELNIPNGLVDLINNFYASTNLNCDMTITKTKIQVRFDIKMKDPNTKNILDRNILYKFFYEMSLINQFIEDLIKLLSY